jgi:magnesium transporter
MIVHFPVKREESKEGRISQLSIFAGADYIVTVHQGDLRPLVDMFQLCSSSNNNNQQQQKDTIMGKSSGYLLHSIIDALVDDLFHILNKVAGNIHELRITNNTVFVFVYTTFIVTVFWDNICRSVYRSF